MRYEMKVDGMAEISELLEKMGEAAPGVAAHALYEGAGVMQKAYAGEIRKIKAAPFKYAKSGERRLPSPEEKAILEEVGIGIAKFDKNGAEVDTSVGFNNAEYADVNWNHMSNRARTNYKAVYVKGHESNSSSLLKAIGMGKGAQNQKPIGVIANAINSGTSFMSKQPFARKARNAGAQKAISTMKENIEEAFENMIKK